MLEVRRREEKKNIHILRIVLPGFSYQLKESFSAIVMRWSFAKQLNDYIRTIILERVYLLQKRRFYWSSLEKRIVSHSLLLQIYFVCNLLDKQLNQEEKMENTSSMKKNNQFVFRRTHFGAAAISWMHQIFTKKKSGSTQKTSYTVSVLLGSYDDRFWENDWGASHPTSTM